MATQHSTASFLDHLRASGLLSDAQLAELRKCPEARDPSPTPLARVVLRRGWLTPFQLNAVAAGRGKDLVVGPYVLLDKLGEGGMGTVYKARHEHMNRVVALKVIRKEKLGSAEAVKRFYQEVRVAGALHHPNIVMAYDAGPVGNAFYLAMEYVEGVDLGRLVKERGPLPVAQACDYVRQAALGLRHAHEKGLVHRDVKPANLLVGRDSAAGDIATSPAAAAGARGDVVKLLDMGLARLQSAGDTGVTRLGAVIGSPDFLAPEQAMNSRAADIRADLYSLGCTLYFLLTGNPPFAANELTEVLLKHQMEKPAPLAQRGVNVPAGVQGILDRLMAKDPADRYQTPAELADALAPFCRAGAPAAKGLDWPRQAAPPEENEWAALTQDEAKEKGRSESGSRTVDLSRGGRTKAGQGSRDGAGRNKKRLLLAGAGGGVGLLGALALLLWWKAGPTPDPLAEAPRPTQPAQKAPDPPGRGDKPAPPGDSGKDPAPPPDGGKPAPPAVLPPVLEGKKPDQPAHRDYLVKENLPSVEFATAADGGVLATVDEPHRLRVEADGSRRVYLFNSPQATIDCFALTPDGGRLLVAYSDRTLRLWRIGEPKEQHILKGHTEPVKCLAVSPDGKTALSGGGKAGGTDTAIRVWDLGGGTEIGKLQGHDGPVERLAFSPDGKRAVSVGDSDVRVWDVAALKELRHLDALRDAGPLCAAFSPDGNRLLVGDRGGALTLVEAATGRELRRFTQQSRAAVWDVAFTPDGERFVAARALRDGGVRALVGVWSLERGEEYFSSQMHTKSARRVFVADGGRLAYSSGDDGRLYRNDVPPLPDRDRRDGAP